MTRSDQCFLFLRFDSSTDFMETIQLIQSKLYALINPLGARDFWEKCWILTSRFQKLVAWKSLKIEIYCKLEKCWAWPKVYVGCKYTHLICIIWRHQGAALLNFIIFIFAWFFLSFYPQSANNVCNTSSRYNFLLAIWLFSLTIYWHAMNWTASASMTHFLERFE